jgi:fatty-acyl-CoA synthase
MTDLGLSHVTGANAPPLIEYTIGEALARAAQQWPDRPALISAHQGIRWTYRDLLERADRLAAGLLKRGVKPGDRIGIWSPNCAEWTLTQFAAARIGAILVTINPAYRLSEVEYTLNKVGVKVLVAAERFKNSDYVGIIEQ